MKKFIWLAVSWVTTIGPLHAQDYSLQSLYRIVPSLVNPSMTGLNGDMRLQLLYKKQLTGFENSPNMRMLSFQMGIPSERIGLGVNISQDQNGPLLYSQLSGLFSYQIEFEKSSYRKMKNILSFGLSPSFAMFQIKKSGLDPLEEEPLLDNFIGASIKLNGDFGVYMFMNGFELGFSTYNLQLYSTSPTSGINARLNPLVYLNLGYVSDISGSFDIYPSILLSTELISKESNYSDKVSADLNMMANVYLANEAKLTVGAGYRYVFQNNSPISETALIVGGFKYNTYAFSYQYNFPSGSGLQVWNGEHSLGVGLLMDAKYKKGRKKKVNNWFR